MENRLVYIINKDSIEIIKNSGLDGLRNTKYFSVEEIKYKMGFLYINDKKIPFSFDFL
jgi:hypothetical protein